MEVSVLKKRSESSRYFFDYPKGINRETAWIHLRTYVTWPCPTSSGIHQSTSQWWAINGKLASDHVQSFMEVVWHIVWSLSESYICLWVLQNLKIRCAISILRCTSGISKSLHTCLEVLQRLCESCFQKYMARWWLLALYVHTRTPAVAKGPESTQHILSHSIVKELHSHGST